MPESLTTTEHGSLEPDERVLSTLNRDGSRRWIYPRLSRGRFLSARRAVAYVLIAVFALLPHWRVAGKPAILLDVAKREFTFFGFTFLPTDTVLLALFLVGVVVTIFLVTAVFGRAWCGWACPQTVYMEFLYRPVERLFDGRPRPGGRPGRKRSVPRSIAKYTVFLAASMFLAHTFLAYFVGVEALARWVRQSPLEHPGSFLVMAVTTGLMMFDFSYFREQMCIVACPYGRLQSVLLDRDSLVVSYDAKRGEPRGKPRRRSWGGTAELGDCVDCELCVDTCPTGIDIRDGLKMECVACTQCIDACDAVMTKLKRRTGLIRYSSQARIAGGQSRLLRPRVIVYPLVLTAVVVLFSLALASRKRADIKLLRGPGVPFAVLKDGTVANNVRVKITHRGSEPASYLLELGNGQEGRLVIEENPIRLDPGTSRTEAFLIAVPPHCFERRKHDATVVISDGKGFSRSIVYRLLGPAARPKKTVIPGSRTAPDREDR